MNQAATPGSRASRLGPLFGAAGHSWAARTPRLWVALNAARLAALRPTRYGGAICVGPSNEPWIALTFDDGPDPKATPAVLDVLERAGARATFFVLGAALEANAELARAIAARHEIATHLHSHSREACRSVEGFDEEVRRAFDAHLRVLGETPSRLRFPFGDRGAVRRSDIEKWGLTDHRWTFSSEDSSAASAREIVEHVAPRVHAGAVVLLHDGRGPNSTCSSTNRSAMVEALPRILEVIARRGFRAVSLREMFGDAAGRPAKHMPWPERLEHPHSR